MLLIFQCLFSDVKKCEASNLFHEKVLNVKIVPTVQQVDDRFDEHRKMVLSIQKETNDQKDAAAAMEKQENFVRTPRRKLSPEEHNIVHAAFDNLQLDQITGSGLLKAETIDHALTQNAELKAVHDTLATVVGANKVKGVITSSLRAKTRAFYFAFPESVRAEESYTKFLWVIV